MPDVNGKRSFLGIKNQIYFDAECLDPVNTHEALIQVSHFFFYKHAFEKANTILLEALVEQPSWIVIDEIGKLELKGKGLYYSVNKIIDSYSQSSKSKLLIVIRESLTQDAISHFHIKEYTIINDLKSLPE